jgi:hypothetical protein
VEIASKALTLIFTKLTKTKIKDSYVKTAQTARETRKSIALILGVILKQAGLCFIKKIRTLTRTTKDLLATLAHLTTSS